MKRTPFTPAIMIHVQLVSKTCVEHLAEGN